MSTDNAEKSAEKVPSNMTELRDELLLIFSEVRAGKMENLSQAKELSNAAGKIIKSAAVQVEYATLRKEVPNIPFLK